MDNPSLHTAALQEGEAYRGDWPERLDDMADELIDI